MEQLSFAIEWPEKNLPLPPMRSMRSGVWTGFSSVANDDLWNAKRMAAICQCNRLSYHRTKRTTETSQWRRRLRRYLHTIIFISMRILRKMFKCSVLSRGYWILLSCVLYYQSISFSTVHSLFSKKWSHLTPACSTAYAIKFSAIWIRRNWAYPSFKWVDAGQDLWTLSGAYLRLVTIISTMKSLDK